MNKKEHLFAQKTQGQNKLPLPLLSLLFQILFKVISGIQIFSINIFHNFQGFLFLKYKNSFLLRNYKRFFRGLRFQKYRKFCRAWAEKFNSLKYKKAFQGFCFLKYNDFFSGLPFTKNEKIYKKINIRTRKFHFSKYTELFFGWVFKMFFSSLCLKVFQVAAYYTTRNYFQKHSKNI